MRTLCDKLYRVATLCVKCGERPRLPNEDKCEDCWALAQQKYGKRGHFRLGGKKAANGRMR